MLADVARLARLGANLCGDDRFEIVSCPDCGHHYLFNVTVKDIYYDPAKLSRRFFLLPGVPMPPCVGCGCNGWQAMASVVFDPTEVLAGPWGWVFSH